MKTFVEFIKEQSIENQETIDEQDDFDLAKKIGEGIFTIDFINKILDMKSLEDAKNAALDKVENSDAKEVNKNKARTLVNNAKSIRDLSIAMSNFSLKHQKFGVVK